MHMLEGEYRAPVLRGALTKGKRARKAMATFSSSLFV